MRGDQRLRQSSSAAGRARRHLQLDDKEIPEPVPDTQIPENRYLNRVAEGVQALKMADATEWIAFQKLVENLLPLPHIKP
jgi:hypothetical protein